MEGSKKEIVEATRRALVEHGYAELSVQRIAEEFPKSKSLFYHHYNGKEDIIQDYMEKTLEEFEKKCLENLEDDPEKALESLAFLGFDQDEETLKPMIEIRAHSMENEALRKNFREFSRAYRSKLVEVIEEGKKDSVFRQGLDCVSVAEFVDAVNREAMFSRASGMDTEYLERELTKYLEERVHT